MGSHAVTDAVTVAVTNGGSHTSPTRPDPLGTPPVPANRPATRRARVSVSADRLAARIAANAIAEVDELALVGYPALDPAHRDVAEQAIRLAARRELER